MSMIVYTVLSIIFFSIIRSILFYMKEIKAFNLDGPIPMPLIGNLYNIILKKPNEFLPLLRSLKNQYGNACLVHLFHNPYIILSHSKYTEGLMSNVDHIKKGTSYQYLWPWLGDGLLTSTGQRWKLHRKFLSPAFHFNILQNFLPVFLKNEKILIKKLKQHADGTPLELFPIIALNALDNVTESIMGVEMNAQNHSESDYVKAVETLSTIIALKMRKPIYGVNVVFNLTSYKKMHDDAIKVLHAQTKKVIDARKEEIRKYGANSGGSSDLGIKNKHAFLDLLLLSEIDGQKISDEHIREEVDTFMFEGHDTTTSGIAFALYSISQHPDIQAKVLEEQKQIFGDDLFRDPTYAELQQMKYLEMVIKESLRLYPSVPLIQRMITKDCEISGIKVMKDTTIIVNLVEIQRQPDVFENPMEFRPERFAASNTPTNSFSWIAFSAGPRNCIGQKFAMMEMKVVIASVIKHFKLLPVPGELVLCADLVLRSETGVKVRFVNRH